MAPQFRLVARGFGLRDLCGSQLPLLLIGTTEGLPVTNKNHHQVSSIYQSSFEYLSL